MAFTLSWTSRLPALVLMVVCGCASRAEEPASSEGTVRIGTAAAVATGSAGSMIAGYQHTLTASRIHLGSGIANDQFGVMQRWVGSDGTFAINELSGMALGLQNSSSPAYTAPPYSGGFEGHKDAVRAYFLSAGIPPEQILGVGGSSTGFQTGTAAGPSSAITVVGYGSTLGRGISGFHVVESFAVAQINANNDVVRESVYWPPLPASLVDDATQIAGVLADPTAGPAFLSSLPIQGASSVAIHHTSGALSAATQFVAFASLDVQVGPGETTHHFDVSGRELFTTEEAIRAPDVAPRTSL